MSDSMFCDFDIIHEDVVNKVKTQMPAEEEFYQLAQLYKMFGDKTRVQILSALSHNEMCVCDLAALLGMTQSAISHQLKSLRIANLVRFRKDGKIVYYSLADEHVEEILKKGFEHINE